jgi:tetratricopeptide (TPR) repeat protein
MGRNERAIADFEVALACRPNDREIREWLAMRCHIREIYQSRGPEKPPDPQRRLALARRAVELVPDEPLYLNALGTAQYRVFQFAEAIATWERDLAPRPGWFDDRNYFFLAMAHHRMGNRIQAQAYFDRGVRCEAEYDSRADPHPVPLATIRAAAAAVLAGPAGELPDEVFAPPR